jgi:hypothetical protein
MKGWKVIGAILILLLSCQRSTEPLVPGKLPESSVYLKTDKTLYHFDETMHLTLVNDGQNDIRTGLICGGILALQWSPYPDTTWSWFLDPSIVLCPSFDAILSSGESYNYELQAHAVGDTGYFILRVPVQEAEEKYAYSPVICIVP